MKILFGIALSLLLIMAGACATSGGNRNFRRADYDLSSVKKIAVLPFHSFVNKDEYAGEKIRRVVITELLTRGYEVVEPGEVSSELGEFKKLTAMLTTEDLKKIGKSLSVDAIVMGSVDAYGISPGLTVQYPDVSVNMRLLDAGTGKVVWSISHSSGGPGFATRHFGAEGPSLGSTAHAVVRESIDTLVSGRRGD